MSYRTLIIIDAFIQPGQPAQNAHIEQFNRTGQENVLDLYLFSNLDEVKDRTTRCMYEYNAERPHESLGNKTPYEFLKAN